MTPKIRVKRHEGGRYEFRYKGRILFSVCGEAARSLGVSLEKGKSAVYQLSRRLFRHNYHTITTRECGILLRTVFDPATDTVSFGYSSVPIAVTDLSPSIWSQGWNSKPGDAPVFMLVRFVKVRTR